MTVGCPLEGDIAEWDFRTGEALKVVSASIGNLNHWERTGVISAITPRFSGSGNRRCWLFTDLLAAEIVWRLADEIGYDIDRLRGKDLSLNLRLAQALFGWNLALVIAGDSIDIMSIPHGGSLTADGATVAIICFIEPIATQLARTARSLRAEAKV